MFLNRLRRVTRDHRWIPEIDGLRFVAICSVFLYHVFGELSIRSGRVILVEPGYGWLAQILNNGRRGVELFFVISGLILALPFARHFLLGAGPVSLRKYFMRRVTRLEPPYIASMIVAVLLFGVYRHGLPPGYLPHALASLFYQHNLVYGELSWVNPVTWSLEVEIQFYIVAPIVMQFYRIRRTWLRRIVLLACILGVELAQPAHASLRVQGSILFYLQYFLAGLLVADVFVLELKEMSSSWIWDLAGVSALGAIFWFQTEALWMKILLPVAIGVLCLAVMKSHGLRRVLGNPWVAVVGGMCYSIYLLHFLLIAVLFKVTRHAILPGQIFVVNYAIQLLLLAVPVLLMCAVFFVLVERPCMDPNWPSKLWRKVAGRSDAVDVLDSGLNAE